MKTCRQHCWVSIQRSWLARCERCYVIGLSLVLAGVCNGGLLRGRLMIIHGDDKCWMPAAMRDKPASCTRMMPTSGVKSLQAMRLIISQACLIHRTTGSGADVHDAMRIPRLVVIKLAFQRQKPHPTNHNRQLHRPGNSPTGTSR